MLKSEFERVLGKEVTEADYRIIDIVYMWHPSNLSKEAVAVLYEEFGMALIKDMMPRADKMKELEERKRRAEGEIHTLDKLMNEVKNGEDLSQIERLEKDLQSQKGEAEK